MYRGLLRLSQLYLDTQQITRQPPLSMDTRLPTSLRPDCLAIDDAGPQEQLD